MGKINIILQRLVPHRLFSSWMGKLGTLRRPVWLKNFLIKTFIKRYHVDLSQAVEPNYKNYACFNDFFSRRLQSSARPVAQTAPAVVSPADGIITQQGLITGDQLIQAKGQYYSLLKLLNNNKQDALLFENGLFMTVYLSPQDYHRVHLPLEGKCFKKVTVEGDLFSVNPQTASRVPGLFARNARTILLFETPAGKMAVIFIGAMIVSSMVITAPQHTALKKGAELGYFQLGSTVIVLFQKDRAVFDTALNQRIKTGEAIGRFI